MGTRRALRSTLRARVLRREHPLNAHRLIAHRLIALRVDNHHAHPTSARHGLAWYEFDISWITIKVLRLFGVAKKIQVASVHSRLADREAA